jgi:hypothetical protein
MSSVTSTFDTDDDGWTMLGDVASSGWQATGGDPGGYYQWVDAATGADSYFNAPSKFLGDMSAYYGGSLTYSLQDTGDNYNGVPDIKLIGDGMELDFYDAGTPGITPSWGNFSATLTASGWETTGGSAATTQEMDEVLGDLTQLEIRGEYVDGGETGGIDNVVMSTGSSGGGGASGAPVSTFDNDDDGWTMSGDVASSNWVGSGGDPGGYFQWVDAATGADAYFVAPEKFLGDKSAYYGGALTYSLQDTGSGITGIPDIELIGDGIELDYYNAGTPGLTPAWGNFSASLTAAGWETTGGAAATVQQMQEVLGDLTGLEIRAEYVDGDETGGIDNVVMSAVCFASGVRLATARGEVAVESLAIGDLVRTTTNELRPIKWLGHRTIAFNNHPNPKGLKPVRIAAHAFGPGKPVRDLLLSPAHAVAVDLLGEVLVPVGSLVNGATIAQLDVDQVTYWHVELDSHDLLLAENLAAESYLDTGNRRFFIESRCTDLRASSSAPDSDGPVDRNAFCRPFHDRGPLVQALRLQLNERAKALGWSLAPSTFAGLHMFANGVRIEARTDGLTACFSIPADVRDVWLVCETSRPVEIGRNDDDRDLGVDLSALTFENSSGVSRRVEAGDPRLNTGFHEREGAHRWISSRAHIPAELFADLGAASMRVELAGPAIPRWISPAHAEKHELLRRAS